jgi:hypothetical protein
LLEQSADPRVRALLIDYLHDFEVDERELLARLLEEENASVRQAILLALGKYRTGAPDSSDAGSVVENLRAWYTTDPDSGVHTALEWLLRGAGHGPWLDQMRGELSKTPRRGWYVTTEMQTMIVMRGPVSFSMGSPYSEAHRDSVESPHRRQIDRTFALGACEVTVQEFLRFRPEFEYARDASPDPNCPINKVSWYDAAQYCRWLSEREGIPEDQMCYPPIPEIRPGLRLPDDYLSRTGYRLPTESEWEFACRAHAETSRFFGDSELMLARYDWFVVNSQERTWPVGRLRPNPFGFFDLYGNVMEWCSEPFAEYRRPSADPPGVYDDFPRDDSARLRVLRGASYRHTPKFMRSAKRLQYEPVTQLSIVGFRIARTLSD